MPKLTGFILVEMRLSNAMHRIASYFAAQKWMLWTSKVQNLAGASGA
jgi:hypothetical protein